MSEPRIKQTKPRAKNVSLVLAVKTASISVMDRKHMLVELIVEDSELGDIIEAFGSDRILDFIGTKAINDFLK